MYPNLLKASCKASPHEDCFIFSDTPASASPAPAFVAPAPPPAASQTNLLAAARRVRSDPTPAVSPILRRDSAGVVLFVVLVATTLLCLLTGNARRSYVTLGRSDSVIVLGKTIALEQLAAAFQPLLVQRPGDHSPPALTMWWEAVDNGDSIVLVYHPVWQDERNPLPLLHWMYYAYRTIVYGIPVRDIEYIQININRATGLIDRMRYEGSTAGDYNVPMAQHIRVVIDRADGDYIETATLPNNDIRVRSLQ